MNLETTLKTTALLDTYYNILTYHQQKIMELYFYHNLSLAEIAVECNISKQAVSDLINRCEKILQAEEKKLKLIEKKQELLKYLKKINLREDYIKQIISILDE